MPAGYIICDAREFAYGRLIKQRDEFSLHLPLEGIARIVVGTASSMGVVVRESDDV